LLVVLDHLHVPGFQGGFIGVDVFFVISGYLITSLLAAEYAKHGSISIRRFYVRRARRILPAALTVILAVVVASRWLLNPLRVEQVQGDSLWTVFFAANFNCIRQATDYFAQFAEPSPFQHYWSLAVEEQFYFVWPALFLLVTLRPGVRLFGLGWRARGGIAIAALGVASLWWSSVATASEPLSAYFSPFTRAWELALGASIGICVTRTTQLRGWLAASLSVGGAVLVLIGLGLIDATTPFPGGMALLPTLGTALLILGGLTVKPPLPNRALSMTPLRFLGRISYSVYLWHWPLIVFAAALYPTAGKVTTSAAVLVLTLLLSTLSFYLVEQPARRRQVVRKDRRLRRRDRTAWVAKRVSTVAVGASALVALFAGALSVMPVGGGEARAAVYAVGSGGAEPAVAPARGDTRYAQVLRAWQRKVRAGLAIRTLSSRLQPLEPHLSPPVEPSCNRSLAGVVAGECVVGPARATHVAVLTGDSHAGMFQIALSRVLGRGSWRLHIFQRGRCGWAGGVPPGSPITPSECRAYQAQTLSRIRALRPNVIVLSQADVITSYRTRSQISASLRAFSRLARRVILLGHTPTAYSFAYCLSGSADISRCVRLVPGYYRSAARLESTLATRAGADFVDTLHWFCAPVSGGRTACPAVVENAPVWRDGGHVSAAYEAKLVPLMRASLSSAG
jgi:peptidoglycan/LPS O-acetylase OafA/YrhL